MRGEMLLFFAAATLHSMQVHFVTGKGGVGKSAVAAGLAMKLSQGGHKVLLAELGEESFYQNYWGLQAVTSEPTASGLGFDVALWSGASCLREYAVHLLKIEGLYRLFFENPVSKTLIDVAPALPELAILGKITSGPPRNVGPKLPYDCLVIDSFASGHFIAMMKAPIGLSEAIRVGPMGKQSREIHQVLKDPKISHYHLVCLPEELPVQESIELEEDLRKLMSVAPTLWLNKWIDYPEDLSETGAAFERDFFIKKRRQEEALLNLKNAFDGRLRKLPFVFEVDEKILVKELAKEISR